MSWGRFEQNYVYNYDINACLIKMKAEGMPCTVQDEPALRKTGPDSGFIENIPHRLLTDMPAGALPGKQPVRWFCIWVIITDVIDQDDECPFGKDCIAFRAVL